MRNLSGSEPNRPVNSKTHLAFALAAAILAFAAGCWLNRADMYNWNIGVSHDSIFYLDAAKNILSGLGVVNNISGEAYSMTHYPPFYPLVLASISFIFGVEPLRAAYLLGIFLLGANTLLIGAVVYKYAFHSIWAGLTAALLMLVAHAIVVTHYMAWSEPLFLLLVLSGLLLLDRYLTSGKLPFLVLTGVLFALAIFTRYVGFILLPFAGLAVLLFRRQSLVQYIKHIVLFGLPSVILIGGWMLRNRVQSGKSTNRSIQFLGFGDARVTELKTTIRNWFFSDGSVSAGFNRTMLVLLMALILLVVLYRYDFKRGIWQQRSKLAELCLLFGISYAAFLVVSVTFVDASTPLDDRMLVPLFVGLLGAFLGVFWRSALLSKNKLGLLVLLPALAWFAYNRFNYTQYFHNETRAHGNGFTSKEGREADAAEAIQKLPENTTLYAPGFEYVYLHYLTGRFVKPFTDLEDPEHQVPDNAYATFLQPCCPDGNRPYLPTPYQAGEPKWGQHLYPISKPAAP